MLLTLLLVCGCTTRSPGRASTSGASTLRPTPPERDLSSLEASCALLNTRDLASFFPTHTETILPKPQIGPVGHPAFSTDNAPGTETSCVYYTFYLPGSHSEVVLQVNYWLDVPASASSAQAWRQAWAAASAQQTQTAPGIGDGSFYADGRLSFRNGDVYMTVEATETDWNLSTASDRSKQLILERRVAADIISHLKD